MSVHWQAWRDRRGDRTRVLSRQRARITELIAHARARSPYFRAHYADLTRDFRLTDLPPTSKPELMARFDEWVTDPEVRLAELNLHLADPDRIGTLFRDRYLVSTSSGSSGDRAVILQDEPMRKVAGTLGALRAMPALGVGLVREIAAAGGRMANLVATDGHFGGVATAEFQRAQRKSRAERLRVFSVHAPIEETVAALNEYQPAMLGGYATAQVALAHEQLAGRLRIAPVLITTGGEAIPGTDRALLAQAFGAEVRNQYGCSEFMLLTFACALDRLHVNDDWAILEPVDDRGHPVSPGIPSTSVLLTNLANRVQPIIRYNLGDSITIDPDICGCGRQFPTLRVQGRTNDLLELQAPDGSTVRLLPLAVTTVVDGLPGVRRFQIVQTAPAHLHIRLDATNDDAWPHLRDKLGTYLAKQGLGTVDITLDHTPPQRDPGTGKFKLVIVRKN
ncbi:MULTISPECIES: phenylacetate--CoA ligase family protein [unclassified Crossiella]|uniref:phenylacetate--CoA ligase family protein n=1 Tax=unclassified Crossiella TaxID=2620835 RepID=UPI001FFF497B|nr:MULTISPECIES: phenylacetate--CoA ligase family protein [unclassified Crossiella]MCK2242901.1 phenylacetate--CoA ligase family protein [Crossiella sp. S99.2]MCK2256778.1 phenylacetate--CoA ligase family protein [Crossiella sp. S99.1]